MRYLKARKQRGAAALSGDSVSRTLEIAQLPRCDSRGSPPLLVDKALAAADELRPYFRGYFCFFFARRITEPAAAREPGVKAGVFGLENESYAEAKQMVMRWSELFWHGAPQISDALFCCPSVPTSTVFPGPSASGRSSCNNTAVTEL